MHQETDSLIEQLVLRKFCLDKDMGSREVCVLCSDGVVTLSGSVAGHVNRLAAATAASRAAGVEDVVNKIRVKPCTALIRNSSITVTLARPDRPSALVHPIAIEGPVAEAVTMGT